MLFSTILKYRDRTFLLPVYAILREECTPVHSLKAEKGYNKIEK